ncbi:MAG TPA: GTPase Era, partial [Actinomycetota bacterium]|nr:GTPase Era [Actinomycetota bacterium]
IVSDVPQTTRNRIRGVLTTDDAQVVFTDTPGFHKPRTLLGERLNRIVEDSTDDVDAAVLVVDAASGVGRGDAFVAERRVAPLRCPKLCAVNKIDLVRPDDLVRQLDAAAALTELDHVVPVSARTGRGVDRLRDLLAEAMPVGPAHFPPDQVTDQRLEDRVAEIVREKALHLTREEVPHSIAVQLEDIERERGLTRISCVVLVERESQKGIVIGRGGGMLKRIGTTARRELEAMLGNKVFLELRVKVLREWQRDPAALSRLGY